MQIMPTSGIKFILSKNASIKPPNIRVYSLAAKYISSKQATTVRSALSKAFCRVYGLSAVRAKVDIETLDRYERQYRRLFFAFPWWDSRITKKNADLHKQSLHLMISTCISAGTK